MFARFDLSGSIVFYEHAAKNNPHPAQNTPLEMDRVLTVIERNFGCSALDYVDVMGMP
jgi:hypothetical protein